MLKYINKTKGFGLFADEEIKKGEFVCEYVGCIIPKKEAERKIDLNHKKQKANYVLQVKECYEKININTYIDAEEYGNVGRFINHSCNPNLVYEFIRVEHLIPRVGFFASRNIQKGEELCFLYSDVDNECNYNSESKSNLSCKLCECGEKNCKKYIPN
jgi:histone-lysine N-methyltransferase SETMAR